MAVGLVYILSKKLATRSIYITYTTLRQIYRYKVGKNVSQNRVA